MAVQLTLNQKLWTSGSKNERYSVSHDGYKVKVMPLDWRQEIRKLFPHGSPNRSLRSAVFKKLGVKMNAGGELFVPWEYTQKTGRKTFRGLSFKQIADIQRRCSLGTYK